MHKFILLSCLFICSFSLFSEEQEKLDDKGGKAGLTTVIFSAEAGRIPLFKWIPGFFPKIIPLGTAERTPLVLSLSRGLHHILIYENRWFGLALPVHAQGGTLEYSIKPLGNGALFTVGFFATLIGVTAITSASIIALTLRDLHLSTQTGQLQLWCTAGVGLGLVTMGLSLYWANAPAVRLLKKY